MAVDTLFRIASMTKPVTSLAVMQLVEQGRISLDDPAEKYLPQLASLKVSETFNARTGAYSLRTAKTAPMVARCLLIRRASATTSRARLCATSSRIRARSMRRVPVLEPGEQWLYSTGIDWGGRIVEALSGKKLETYFRDHIFTPLGMTETAYNPPDNRRPRLRPRASASPRRHVRSGSGSAGVVRAAACWRRRARLDGVRLHPVPADAAQSGHVERHPHRVGRNDRDDEPESYGSVGVRAVKTAMPERSSDFTFVADGRDKWGIGFMITADGKPGGRSAGSLSWGGINNTYSGSIRRAASPA